MDAPDYTVEVILSYVLSLALLGVLVLVSVVQSRRARRRLEAMESSRDG